LSVDRWVKDPGFSHPTTIPSGEPPPEQHAVAG
jgi:hypothetical protein